MTLKRELFVPGRFEHLATIADFIAETGREAGFDQDTIFHVQMAVDEACSNIIEHAYGGQNKGDIRLSCEFNDRDWIIIIYDQGRPFNPDSVPVPDLDASLNEVKTGGLGLYFMRQLMDEVEFDFDQQEGNRLRMVKREALKIDQESLAEGVRCLAPEGRLDALTVPEFDKALRDLISGGTIRILVDMQDVTYISSSGLRALLTARRMAQAQDGEVKLCGLSPRVYEIFDMVGFDQIFEIYDSVEAARASF